MKTQADNLKMRPTMTDDALEMKNKADVLLKIAESLQNINAQFCETNNMLNQLLLLLMVRAGLVTIIEEAETKKSASKNDTAPSAVEVSTPRSLEESPPVLRDRQTAQEHTYMAPKKDVFENAGDNFENCN